MAWLVDVCVASAAGRETQTDGTQGATFSYFGRVILFSRSARCRRKRNKKEHATAFVSDGPSAPGRRLVPSGFKAHPPTPLTLASSLRVDPVGGHFVAAQKGGRTCRPGRDLLLWPMATGSVK